MSLTSPFLYTLICIYNKYTSHVIKAHVSLGSQFQKCPHACFAHMAPDSMPKVRKAVPIYIRVSADESNASESDLGLNRHTNAIRNAHPNREYENI